MTGRHGRTGPARTRDCDFSDAGLVHRSRSRKCVPWPPAPGRLQQDLHGSLPKQRGAPPDPRCRAEVELTSRPALARLQPVLGKFQRARYESPPRECSRPVRDGVRDGVPRPVALARRAFPLRKLLLVLLSMSALWLPGCPIFASDNVCYYDGDCAPGYACQANEGRCVAETPIAPDPCATPGDCRPGETCSAKATCVPGDCTFSGCVDGWQCDVVDGRFTCVSDDLSRGGAAGAAGAAGAQGASGSQ